MRKVTVAENAGFCFGVSLAANKIETRLREGGDERLFTLGHLIHNQTYNNRLAAHGVHSVTLEEIEALGLEVISLYPGELLDLGRIIFI